MYEVILLFVALHFCSAIPAVVLVARHCLCMILLLFMRVALFVFAHFVLHASLPLVSAPV